MQVETQAVLAKRKTYGISEDDQQLRSKQTGTLINKYKPWRKNLVLNCTYVTQVYGKCTTLVYFKILSKPDKQKR